MSEQIYKVRDPSGAIREIRGPVGASDEQVLAKAMELLGGSQTDPATAPAPSPPQTRMVGADASLPTNAPPGQSFFDEQPARNMAQEIAGSPVTRFALGAASPFLAAGQIANRVLPQSMQTELGLAADRIAPMVQAGRSARGSEGVDVANLAGSVMSPAALAAMRVPMAGTLSGRIAQGGAIGGLLGLGTPVEDPEDFVSKKAQQVGTGVALGGAIPGVAEGVRGAYRASRNIIQPFLPGEKGLDLAAGRTMNKAAGPDREQIIAALRSPEVVPGSTPGAGEKAANVRRTEFSALQEAVKVHMPTPYDRMARASHETRDAHLGAFAGDRQKLADALKARDTRANEAYGAVRGDRVNLESESDLLARPSVAEGLKDATQSAAEKGVPFPENASNGLTVGNLQRVKESLDSGIKASQSKTVAGIRPDLSPRELTETKRLFVDMLSDKSPGWRDARQDFAQASRGTNQMEIGQEMQKRLTDASGKPTLGKFLSSVDERTDDAVTKLVKNAVTGKPRYTSLDEALEPKNAEITRDVVADALRSVRHQENTGSGAVRAREILGQIAPKVPAGGMFAPTYSVARAVLNRIGGMAEGKSIERLSEIMQDPVWAARIMEAATPSERAMLANANVAKGSRLATIAASLGAAQGQ